MVVIVMGAAGAGKSTVGRALADELGWPFTDADDLHDAGSIAKMRQGIGLEDAERWPWLRRVKSVVAAAASTGRDHVVACSALRGQHRAFLGGGHPDIRFVFLQAGAGLLAERLRRRTGHFAGADLLHSQLEALEPPSDALTVDAARPVEELVRDIRRALTLSG